MNRLRRTRNSLLVTLLLTTCIACALGQKSTAATDKSIDDLLGDHIKFQHLMTTLQQDVTTRDAAGVATLLRYPFNSTINGKEVSMKIPSDFIQNYDSIVTPSLAEVIKKQRYEDLFVNFKGVMFGNGELWIAAICRDKSCGASDMRVITIQSPDNLGKKKKKFPL
jgi:hypothetical protein